MLDYAGKDGTKKFDDAPHTVIIKKLKFSLNLKKKENKNIIFIIIKRKKIEKNWMNILLVILLTKKNLDLNFFFLRKIIIYNMLQVCKKFFLILVSCFWFLFFY